MSWPKKVNELCLITVLWSLLKRPIIVTRADYSINLALQAFVNPLGQLETGECCDLSLASNCQCGFFCPGYSQCDTRFSLCLEPLSMGSEKGDRCETVWTDTGVIHFDADSFSFQMNHRYSNTVYNPQTYYFKGDYEGFYLKLRIMDVDNEDIEDPIDSYVLRFTAVQYPLNVTHNITYKHYRYAATNTTFYFDFYAVNSDSQNSSVSSDDNDQLASYAQTTTDVLSTASTFSSTSSVYNNRTSTTSTSERKARDCWDLRQSGIQSDGAQIIFPANQLSPVNVYCDMTTDGGGWTVFQIRSTGELRFAQRNWTEYVNGFCSSDQPNTSIEYWLGLERIHVLTNKDAVVQLRIEVTGCDNVTKYQTYDHFRIGDSSDKYNLSVSEASTGTAGDSFRSPLTGYSEFGQKFTTIDQDNDKLFSANCVSYYNGAWWYNACGTADLNGNYYPECTYSSKYIDGISWLTAFPTAKKYSAKSSKMMLRKFVNK